MGELSNNFEIIKMPVDLSRESYTTDSLFERVISALVRRELYDKREELLLSGVAGTRKLIVDKTHSNRFKTFGVPTSYLPEFQDIDDPFVYAGNSQHLVPTLMVYDLQMLTDRLESRGMEATPGMWGVSEGNLDPATRAVIVMRPQN